MREGSDAGIVREALDEYLPHSADCSTDRAGLQPDCDCHHGEVYAALARLETALRDVRHNVDATITAALAPRGSDGRA